MSNLTSSREQLNKILTRRSTACQQVKDERSELAKAEDQLTRAMEAQQILQTVAQAVQQNAHDRIAHVVTHCLASVFGEDAYEFKIVFERKRGRTEARLLFVRDGHEISPRSGSGGGVLDVASFALRLACLMLTKPSPRRLLVLDEPFKFVHSPIYRERVRIMLETLAEQMDFQFILSTGIEEYQCGKVIEL